MKDYYMLFVLLQKGRISLGVVGNMPWSIKIYIFFCLPSVILKSIYAPNSEILSEL